VIKGKLTKNLMKNKKFDLTKIEEKYFFPIGRKTWQIISIISLLLLFLAIIYYLINVIPASRNSVHISKEELAENKLILVDKNVVDKNCSEQDYKQAFLELKKQMPLAEWNKLGDSVEVEEYREYEFYEEYREYEGDYYEYDGSEETYYHEDQNLVAEKYYKENDTAVPNIINLIYKNANIDSANFCKKIKVLEVLKELNSHTKKQQATKFLLRKYSHYTSSLVNFDANDAFELIKIIEKINKTKVVFSDFSDAKDPINEFDPYYQVFNRDTINNERIVLVNDIIDKLNSSKSITKKEIKHQIALLIFSSSLDDFDIQTVSDDFFANIGFVYNDENVISEFNKYLNLYKQKVDLEEKDLARRKLEKDKNKTLSLKIALLSFATVLAIATILLLFSIQTILKRDKDKPTN
jgi:hypothetical protein